MRWIKTLIIPTRVLEVVVVCRRSHVGGEAPCGLAQAMHGIVEHRTPSINTEMASMHASTTSRTRARKKCSPGRGSTELHAIRGS